MHSRPFSQPLVVTSKTHSANQTRNGPSLNARLQVRYRRTTDQARRWRCVGSRSTVGAASRAAQEDGELPDGSATGGESQSVRRRAGDNADGGEGPGELCPRAADAVLSVAAATGVEPADGLAATAFISEEAGGWARRTGGAHDR